jgi:hypothetical protein
MRSANLEYHLDKYLLISFFREKIKVVTGNWLTSVHLLPKTGDSSVLLYQNHGYILDSFPQNDEENNR